MKTTYILHGGMSGQQSEANKFYYQKMVEGLDKPKVLLVYFAREKSEYDYLENRDRNNFAWANPKKTINFEVAVEDNFAKQLENHHIIYFIGGKTKKLLASVKNSGANLKEQLSGKIVSGSSAGAHLVSEWFYAHHDDQIQQGLGLLPIAVFTHYRPAGGTEFWLPDEKVRDIEDKLISKVESNKYIKLPEQHAVTI